MNHEPKPSRCFPLLYLVAGLALCGSARILTRADWPEFRGPTGDGHALASSAKTPAGFPLHWSETNNVKWKTEIPFKGWSAPLVLGNQVWVTTATEDGHDFYAIGLDADTGRSGSMRRSSTVTTRNRSAMAHR